MSYPTQDLPPVPEKPTSKRKKKRGGLAAVIVVALLATVALAGGGLYLGGVFATEFVAEPFDSPGVDPFGGSVGDGQSVPITPVSQIRQEASTAQPAADPAAVTQPQPAAPVTTAATPPQDRRLGLTSSGAGATTVTGDTVGLYGGSQNNAVCDVPKLAEFLRANPDKARAWAAVELVPVDQIDAFLATLTPVILRTDTAVINHGFRDGVANPFNAVLQAGTAVLVDPNGVPRVRCKCGNPLLPPKRFNQIKITGNRWLGFDERNITYIERSPRPVENFRIVILCNCGYGPPPTTATPILPPGETPPGSTATTSSSRAAAGCGEYRDGTCVAPPRRSLPAAAPDEQRTATPDGGGPAGGGAAADNSSPGAAESGGGGDRPEPPAVPDGDSESGETFN